MARAVLALGANIGDPGGQIARATAAIGEHPAIALLRQSTVIVTPPWGKIDQSDFHNGVVLVDTTLKPIELLDLALSIEATIGRVREERWGPRVIDIDIITYDDIVMITERLTLPHPYAQDREFVLTPLREIAPEIADWIVTQSARNSS